MEGPSLIIITEELRHFKGKIVTDLLGNTKVDKEKMCGKKLLNIRSWGKHLLLEFDTFFIRIHFLMYGSYRINQTKNLPVRLSMVFDDKQINFYSCSVKIIENTKPEEIYDWRVDVMSDKWDAQYVINKSKEYDHLQVCDLLMDQNLFAGVGNIIKNEVLFNQRIDPNSITGGLSSKQLKDLVDEARNYSWKFYEWKKEYTLKKHWQIMRKKICPRHKIPIIRKKTGKLKRWSFYCTKCQILY